MCCCFLNVGLRNFNGWFSTDSLVLQSEWRFKHCNRFWNWIPRWWSNQWRRDCQLSHPSLRLSWNVLPRFLDANYSKHASNFNFSKNIGNAFEGPSVVWPTFVCSNWPVFFCLKCAALLWLDWYVYYLRPFHYCVFNIGMQYLKTWMKYAIRKAWSIISKLT